MEEPLLHYRQPAEQEGQEMKLKIKTIKDPDTKVEINSAEHEIEQIKGEIKNGFYEYTETAKVEVAEMWEDE